MDDDKEVGIALNAEKSNNKILKDKLKLVK